jgi:hypothetical protein
MCPRAERRAPSLGDRRSWNRRSAAGGVVTMRAMTEPLHLVDATMFWSPTGGGVRRYLQTKHDWLARQPRWRHSIAVPRVDGTEAGAATLPSIALPAAAAIACRCDARRSRASSVV